MGRDKCDCCGEKLDIKSEKDLDQIDNLDMCNAIEEENRSREEAAHDYSKWVNWCY